MEVEGDIRAIVLVALFIGALIFFFDFDSESAVLLAILELVQAKVVLLQTLSFKISCTYICLISSCSSLVRSDNSFISAKFS